MPRKQAAFVVALVLSLGAIVAPAGAQCSGPDDAFEDHDNCATALPITLPFDESNLWVHRHDPDLFAVTVPAGRELRVTLTCDDDLGDVDLVVYEPGPSCGDLWVNFKSSRTSTDYEAIVWRNTTGAPKALVIQVEIWRGSIPVCNRYNLSVAAVVPPATCEAGVNDDFLEENDTCAVARPLPMGSTPGLWVSNGDLDFYSVTVPPGATLDVLIDFTHATADLDLWLYHPNGTCGSGSGEITRSISTDDDERIVWRNDSGVPRAVVVEVDVWTANACNTYGLEVSLTGSGLGTSYCTATPNASGLSGFVSASGSDRVVDNTFTLEASQLTHHSVAAFVCSRDRGWSPAAGGGVGSLCVGGNVGRFDGNVLPTGSQGRVALPVDLTRLPQSGGPVAAMAGDTWCFQAWYRDVAGQQTTSNLTNGLEVTFR